MKTSKPRNRLTRLMIDPNALSENEGRIFNWSTDGTVILMTRNNGGKVIVITWTLEFKQHDAMGIATIFGYETQLDLISVTNTEYDNLIAESLIQQSYIEVEKAFRFYFKDFPFDRPAEQFRILSIRLMESLVDSGEY